MPAVRKSPNANNTSKTIVLTKDEQDKANYKKLSHLEHVLVRPSTYIGSVDKTSEEMYVFVEGKIVKKTIEYIPGLYKIFDEILVNAADHKTRLDALKESGDATVSSVSQIKVDIDRETGKISVYNDGDGIHIVKTDEEGVYAPELIFGHLLSGTNYNDDEELIVGGQNGYGAKLANIFSTEFTIETVDKSRSLKYVQTFTDNMRNKGKPKITTYSSKPYTRISFKPDFGRFGVEGLTDDMVSLLEKRVYDIAAWTDKSVNVSLNGSKLDYKCFEKYVDLYIGPKSEHPRIYLPLNERWEVVVTYSNDSNFEQVSFVNAIHTLRGGKHVDYIVGQIRDGLVEYLKKKKKITVKPATIKNEIYVFLKSTITNPRFDSQTKETLTTPVSKFGSSVSIDNKTIDKIAKVGILERIMDAVENKQNKDFQKTDGRKQNVIRGLPKLHDADKAGTKDSAKCTLILTEGDSAKSSVLSGLGRENRDFYGVFPLRGKLLNVKDVDQEKIIKNAEISAIKKILGLRSDMEYTQENQAKWDLRYGKVMILCDSDVDGSHIKGLLMNMFHSFWPNLLKSGFIITMLTPIVKVSKGKTTQSFYNLGDYQNWRNATSDIHLYNIKYYKGLGTSSANEFREYFEDMKVLNYQWSDSSDNAIDLAFNKKRSDDRKVWLQEYDINRNLDYKNVNVPVDDFINKDLIHFSNYDNIRSIPNMCDGFKPSQRKILYAAFKRNLTTEIKVAQFSGYVSEHSSYHHGEVSLQGAIISMAQNFVGSNNLALLVPNGAFGSRLLLGKDSASPRYIFTQLHPITFKIFRKEDLPVMDYLDDDGFKIEPSFYMPIIPMVLVNGTKGIGTGYSTEVPCHNPKDIIACIRALLKGEMLPFIKPWYCGFKGKIERKNNDSPWETKGVWRIIDETTLEITEIPIGVASEKYKEFLEDALIDKGGASNKKQFIKNYKEQCVDNNIYFQVKLDKQLLTELESDPEELEKRFKLTSTDYANYNNMHLYDADISMFKYNGPYDIIMDFYDTRMKYYVKRKEYQLSNLKNELDILKEKYRFIKAIVDGDMDLRGKTKAVVEEMLESRNFLKLANTVGKETSYDYLVQMPIYSQTKEKLDELRERMERKEEEYETLLGKSENDIWLEELAELEDEVDKYYDDYTKMLEGIKVAPKKKRTVKKKN